MTTRWQLARDRWFKRIEETRGAAIDEVLREVVAANTAELVTGDDAAAWLQGALECLCRGREASLLLGKARELAVRFEHDGIVQLVVAEIGCATWIEEILPEPQRPTLADIERTFHAAISLEPEDVMVHAGALGFFLELRTADDAARFFTAAAETRPAAAGPAFALSRVFLATRRLARALEVLERALAAGCAAPTIAHEAGALAHDLGKHEHALAYVDRCLAGFPADARSSGIGALHHTRALALLALGRHDEALAAAERGASSLRELAFAAHGIRATVAAERDDGGTVAKEVIASLEVPLAHLGELPPRVIGETIAQLRRALVKIEHHQLLARLEARLHRAGLDTDALFEEGRLASDEEPVDGLSVWSVTLDQSLDPARRYESHDRPAWENGWPAYRVTWRVLATDEPAALRLALAAQRRCGEAEAPVVVGIERGEARPKDKPGVLSRSPRHPPQPPA